MTGEELAAAIAAHEAIIEVETGPQGPQGERGPEGPSGRDGDDGEDGHDGDRGPTGPRGETGANGPDGSPGKDGRDGTDGADGHDGKDGQNADPATVEVFDDGIRKADTRELDFTGEGVQVREKNGRAQIHIPGPPKIALGGGRAAMGGGGGGVTAHAGLAGLSADDHPQYAQSTHTHTGGGGVGLAASNTTYTSGTVVLSGGANVTVGTNAQTVTISAAAQTVQTQNMVAISASDALFSSGTVVLTGAGAATVNTAAGSIRISVPVQTAQTGISSIAASDATYTSGQVQFTGSGNVTVRSSAGQRVVIDASQSVQTQNMVAATVGGNSTSAGAGYVLISSGTITLAGGNNVTLSQNGNAVTISAGAGGAATAISGMANSETTYTSGTVLLSGLANVTVRSTTGQAFQFSVPTQSAQTQSNIQAIGNSETTYQTGTVNFSVVGGALTIRSTTGQAFQLSASQSAQTGVSGIANSQTTYTSGTVSLSELGAITIRSTTGNQFQLSVNSQTVQTQNMVALSASNNLYSSGTVILSGGANITVGTNGQTITISAAAGGGGGVTLSRFAVFDIDNTGSAVSSHAPASWWFNPFYLSAPLSVSNIWIIKSVTMATAISSNSSGRQSFSYSHGVTLFKRQDWVASSTNLTTVTTGSFGLSFSRSHTGSSNSVSAAWVTNTTGGTRSFSTTSNASNWAQFFTGNRLFAIPMVSLLSEGEYFLAHRHSSTTATSGSNVTLASLSNLHYESQTGASFRPFARSEANLSQSSQMPAGIGNGIASAVTITTTMAASVISGQTQQIWYANFVNLAAT